MYGSSHCACPTADSGDMSMLCPLGRIVLDCSHVDFPVLLRAIQAMFEFTIVKSARVLSIERVGSCSFHWNAGAALACFPAWLVSGAVNVKAGVLAGVSSCPLIKSDVWGCTVMPVMSMQKRFVGSRSCLVRALSCSVLEWLWPLRLADGFWIHWLPI